MISPSPTRAVEKTSSQESCNYEDDGVLKISKMSLATLKQGIALRQAASSTPRDCDQLRKVRIVCPDVEMNPRTTEREALTEAVQQADLKAVWDLVGALQLPKYWAECILCNAKNLSHDDIVHYLLSESLIISEQSRANVLVYAIKQDWDELFSDMLSMDPKIPESMLDPALMKAVELGHLDRVEALCEYQPPSLFTRIKALLKAAACDFGDLVWYLWREPFFIPEMEETIANKMVESGHLKDLDFLLENSEASSLTPREILVLSAAFWKRADIVERLLQEGPISAAVHDYASFELED